jgi:chitodextrinase
VLAVAGVAHSAFSAIAYVQGKWAAPQTLQSSVNLTLTSAQNAGDLNVVFIGWHTASAQITSVTDTKGNVYVPALGPTVSSDNRIQYIYYAKNIVAAAASGNTLTVTMTALVDNLDVRVAEYSGVDTTNPLDGVIGAVGDSTSMSTGSLTTTNANDVLVASNYVSHSTTAADPSFTQQMITTDQDILEDRIVTSTGSYSAAATQNVTGPWIIQMAAFKAAGGGGGGDVIAPSVPTNLATTQVTDTQINLGWTASTDNVAVTGYEVQRCQGASCTSWSTVGTPASAALNNTGLSPSTTYRFQVRARDAVPNWSNYSTIFNVTTSAAPDTQAPTIPTNLAVTFVSHTQIDLSWTASTDNVAVTGYEVQRCQGASCTSWSTIGTPASASISSTGLSPLTTYRFQVRARDAVPNWSSYSTIFNVTTSAAPDTQAPTVPSGLGTTLVNDTQINLSWTASSDNVGVTGYEVQRCQGVSCTSWVTVGTPASTSLNNSGLSASTTYRFQVRARDVVPNWSNYSTIFNVTTTAAPDTQAPTVPSGLGTTLVSATQINLTWTGSSDNVGVTAYEVQRCQGASCSNWSTVGTPSSTTQNNTGLTPSTTYRFQVRARDAVPNWSNYSTILNVTTQTPPAAPTGLTSTAVSNKEIDIAWNTVSGATGYVIERCQGTGCSNYSQLGPVTANRYLYDPGLTASTSYSYRVRSVDSFGNESSNSTLTISTLATAACD